MAGKPMDEAFEDVLRNMASGTRRRRLFVIDVGLTELVRYNCIEGPGIPESPWVLTGGFALRHCYGNTRLSADVDLTTEAAIRGAAEELVRRPPGFQEDDIVDDTSDPARPSRKAFYSFARPYGRSNLRVDLNTRRPLEDRPARVRSFDSPFIPDMFKPFDVRVASLEEIVADKLAGFLHFRAPNQIPRAKDLYDLNYVFDRQLECDYEKVGDMAARDRVFESLLAGGARLCEVMSTVFADEDCRVRYRQQWAALGELVEEETLPTFDDALDRLIASLEATAL